nr:hypothetical protein X990_6175 [Burkholderia pseudomallei MSHR4868]
MLVQVARIGRRVLQIPRHVGADAGHAVHDDIRNRLVPADVVVDLRAQAGGDRRRRDDGRRVRRVVPAEPVRPDHHDFALAELLAVRGGFFLRLAAGRRHVGHRAQRLRGSRERGRDRLRIEAGRRENARLHAERTLRGEQRLDARVLAVRRHGADDVRGRLVGVLAFGDAHDDGQRLRLLADRVERAAQRAFLAGLAERGDDVRQQHGRIERKRARVSVGRRADDAEHGRRH